LAAPFWVLPFASRIIVIASFVLLLLLNQIQISNPLGNKKNAHESNSLLLQKRRKMLSHSRTPNETDLSLSLSLSLSRSSTLSSLSSSSLSSSLRETLSRRPERKEMRD
jgi:hypothetical protein